MEYRSASDGAALLTVSAYQTFGDGVGESQTVGGGGRENFTALETKFVRTGPGGMGAVRMMVSLHFSKLAHSGGLSVETTSRCERKALFVSNTVDGPLDSLAACHKKME